MQSEGENATRAFVDAFNAQNHEALAATLNYPHIRLAGGRYMTVDTPEQFAEGSASRETRLRAEGWHHTLIRSLEVVHSGAEKEHIALAIDRCSEDGEVYNSFDTLWIATLQDSHWGIQFRSSFLR